MILGVSQAEGMDKGSGRVMGGGCGEMGVQRSALEEEGGFSELSGGLTPQRRPRERARFMWLGGGVSL